VTSAIGRWDKPEEEEINSTATAKKDSAPPKKKNKVETNCEGWASHLHLVEKISRRWSLEESGKKRTNKTFNELNLGMNSKEGGKHTRATTSCQGTPIRA